MSVLLATAGGIVLLGMTSYFNQPDSELDPGVVLFQYGDEPGGEPPPHPRCGDGECNGDESWDTCPMDCGFCGDGFCGSGETALTCPDCWDICGDGICAGEESSATCPEDCGSNPHGVSVATTVPPPPPTDTPTEPEETEEPVEPPEPVPTATPTEEPAAAIIPPIEPVCELVPFETLSAGWMDVYAAFALPAGFIPSNAGDVEVYVCSEPPTGQVCIPLYDGLLDAVQGDLAHIVLLDCHAGADCTPFHGIAQQEGETLCFNAGGTVDPLCDEGCAWAPVLNCRAEDAEGIAEPVRVAFTVSTGEYLANIWAVCQGPPDELCLPVDPALGITEETLGDFRLYDCDPSGECKDFVPTELRDGSVCFKASPDAGQPLCENGCAFGSVLAGPPGYLIPLIIILIILAIVALVVVLVIARQRREAGEEEYEEEDLVMG